MPDCGAENEGCETICYKLDYLLVNATRDMMHHSSVLAKEGDQTKSYDFRMLSMQAQLEPCESIGYCLPPATEEVSGNAGLEQLTTMDPDTNSWRPVVLMHGHNNARSSMKSLVKLIQAAYPGIYVKNVEIGNGVLTSIFMNLNKQVENFCAQMKADVNLQNGFNLLGFSMGSIITR